jgi:hypothetical protein
MIRSKRIAGRAPRPVGRMLAPALAATLSLALCACQKKPPPPDPVAFTQTAMDAAIWGTPIVSVDAMRQAFFRDGGAKYGDVVYWSRPSDWKNQITTPNASVRYVYFNFNTKDGPVVLEIPAAVGAGLFGSVLDAWQVPLADVGPQGEDQGKGGKYLLLPPGYAQDVPAEYIAVRFETCNGYAAFRAIPEGSSEAAVAAALDLVRKLRVYPLAQAANPPATNFHDVAGMLFDGIVRFDESFYTSLARMVEEEPVLPRDADMVAMLRAIGIEKGKPFAPDKAAQPLLGDAAAKARASFIARLPGDGTQYWPDRQWRTPSTVGAKSGFTFVTDGRLDVEERGRTYFLACAPPKNPGKASFYLLGYVDGAGQPLAGDKTYRLHVPARVPAAQFWAATVYDAETAAFIRESPRVEVNSYDPAMRKNPNGSVDLYFGATAPAGKESNWVYIAPGKPWFTIFRLYGPQPALFNLEWVLADFEAVP